LGVLVLGAAVSITQVVKGAHFVSHVMATAWVCWVLALLLYSFTSWLFVKSPRTL
jgi:membrane-associated PAP2 superfamily phosphatase